jgi:hypothetical protein
MIVFGEAHLRRILGRYAAYYNESRIHRALNKDAPVRRAAERLGAIRSQPVLGGLPSPILQDSDFRYTQVARISNSDYILDMPDRTRKPQNNVKSIDRWDNEGGAPSGGDRSARNRLRDTNLQKKAAAKKSPKKQAQWPR